MNKLDRKLEKYAIPNLSLIMMLCYGTGFLISMLMPGLVPYLTLNPCLIIRGQVWRIVTWLLIPGSDFEILSIIMLLFYYSIGHTLESVWGDYKYNKYIFSGILFTVIGSFVWMFLVVAMTGEPLNSDLVYEVVSYYSEAFTAFYIYMSVFLAFAATFPNNMVLLMFIIPVRIKWLGIAYGAYFGYVIFSYILQAVKGVAYIGYWAMVIVLLSSLMNFLVFFVSTQIRRKGSPKARVHQAQRKHQFTQEIKVSTPKTGVSKHKCAICGRTEITNPELMFRFCSKCNGNYEYCDGHIFNHTHVE